MYVKSVSLSNLRCFREAVLELSHPDWVRDDSPLGRLPNVNLLLGMNGTGKTTILKALAIGVLSPVIQQSGYVPYYLVRRRKGQAGTPTAPARIDTVLVLDQFDHEGYHTPEGEHVCARLGNSTKIGRTRRGTCSEKWTSTWTN